MTAPLDWDYSFFNTLVNICFNGLNSFIRYSESSYPVSYTHLDVYKRQDITSNHKITFFYNW